MLVHGELVAVVDYTYSSVAREKIFAVIPAVPSLSRRLTDLLPGELSRYSSRAFFRCNGHVQSTKLRKRVD
jgi:hypothetical protein